MKPRVFCSPSCRRGEFVYDRDEAGARRTGVTVGVAWCLSEKERRRLKVSFLSRRRREARW